MDKNKQLVATTYAGLEQVLAEELIQLGADDVQPARRSVYFSGDDEMVYRANYSLRTALKVLVPIRNFKIFKVDDLYHQAGKIKWEEFFDLSQTFAVQGKVFSKLFQNSMYASLKVKDAIVDRFRKIAGKRPSVDPEGPDIYINLHVSNNQCIISLDSSGDSLHKRGYRAGTHEAPISEVLAAGMIKLSGWNGKEALWDPMCGSGTLAIEAAMIAKNVLPGEIRKSFAFQQWKNFKKETFERISKEKNHHDINFSIHGSDISRRNIHRASMNAEKALVSNAVQLEIADFRFAAKKPETSFLIFNPPYGERVLSGNQALYSIIGERLKHHFDGSEAWIISTNTCFKFIGLKPTVKIPLFNGSLPCSFRKYELYKGSKKPFK